MPTPQLPPAEQRLLDLYPALAGVDAAERADVLAHEALRAQVPAGTVLFHEGAPCQGFPLVLHGAVRVARGSPGGRTLELYRVTPGELCVVSTACLFGGGGLTAHGRATEPTELVLLSPSGFERWTAHAPFRRFVFGVFADRLTDLMALAEAVAFQRVDQRLAHALLGHGVDIRATHQALADELGTVREIVTRLLRRFERQGWVRLGRERIELLDAAALRELADHGAPPHA
ncbi:MAG: Crp/Fnr family transcriptional regulator [Rubrivivax sp.]|jgi:CRP/FNR family transcriptional regulator|nr:Crp/Fnr family transcriptional regulator [Rubrivivax sp.]